MRDIDALDTYAAGVAETLRDAGMQASLWDRDWSEEARQTIEILAATGAPFTADDVREHAGEPSSTGALGAVMKAAQRDGVIKLIGYRRSRRLPRHGGVSAVWIGVDMETA